MGKFKRGGVKKLNKKQLDVIDDLFECNGNESEVIKKHKVSIAIYRKWLADKNFTDELEFRLESARRQGNLIIAKFTPAAAVNLVRLTESDKEETSRKACLDVMSHPGEKNAPKKESESVCENISAEKAEKMLAVLAKEDRGDK
ncbi:MAG: hypothetical protein K9M75_09505 [Phycisphaerae bacterium]|nr:hypothetical protein [Phycisphaerae bacterium]